jgi:chemotaxis protein MotB
LKETDFADLHKQLEESKAWVTSLENELGKDKNRLELLQNQHAKLAKEKSLVENKLGQMQATYNDLVDDLKKQIQNQEVTIDTFQKKISVTFVDRILFKTGKATITSEGAKVLLKVGKTLKNVKDKKIRVVGHTDNVPIISRNRYYKYPSNWELSAARAARVIRFFQKKVGLDPTTMEAVGRSFYDPVASNETAKGRAQNRRVNIIIAPSF